MDRLETIVADGGSTDGTRQVIELYRTVHPEHRVIVIENRNRIIPSGLNRAIEASSGDILMRLDGHSQPGPGYLNTCVRLLEEGKGDMVGGGLEIIPRNDSWSARCIAVAASNPVGVGDSHFRFSKQAQMGRYDRFFAPTAGNGSSASANTTRRSLSNEDYEFNSRFAESWRAKSGSTPPCAPSTIHPPPSRLCTVNTGATGTGRRRWPSASLRPCG